MKYRINLSLSVAFMLLLGACSMNKPGPGKQVWVDKGYSASVVDGYWLYLPENMDEQKKYPVILFLQGGYGSSPNPITSKEDGPAKFAITDLDDAELAPYVKDSFLIINPHMKPGPKEQRQWAQYDRILMKIVDDVVTAYGGDQSRIYLTGLSRGGHGSWGLLKKHPHRFVAVAPIAGRITCRSNCDQISEIPMWIIHNTGDEIVEFTYAQNAVDHLETELGIDFLKLDDVILNEEHLEYEKIFSALPKEGHDAWNQAYSSPDLYRWFLSK